MNKFKKLLVGVIVAAGVSCLGGAAACASAPDYYTLTFEGEGLEYIMHGDLDEPDENGDSFISGNKVKEGVEVRFSILKTDNAVGDPVITVNGDPIAPGADNIYSFTISKDTTVAASGLSTQYTITLLKTERVLSSGGYYDEERRIEYFDENGEPLGDEVKVTVGEDLKFKLKPSVYYLPGFSVVIGSQVLVPDGEPDDNNVYSYTVSAEDITANNTIGVQGVVEEDGFTAASRIEKCGTGTAENPYLISRPIDLFYIAALVNSSYSSSYNIAHYKLMNDIDMKGEQLYVIGDSSTDSSVFAGEFDGNGHTISNFYITDEVYDQESFAQEYLPYVGLFGSVVPSVGTDGAPAVIKNLTLKDYEVTVHTGEAGAASLVGSLVGFGIGVQITNCHATDGEIIAIGDNRQSIFMGGLVGIMQAAYGVGANSQSNYNAFVASSSTDVILDGTGSPRSAGGIVGYLISADLSSIAYVVNCHSAGDISGAMHAGGIVGTLGRFSSVSNSYSTSAISAYNGVSLANVTESYKVAYAGGIAGFAETDSVITGCYAAHGRLTASSVNGTKYQNTDDFVGGKDAAGELVVDSAEVIVHNSVVMGASDTAAVFTGMGWSENDWDFSAKLPAIKVSEAARRLTINIKTANDADVESYERSITDTFFPMYNWYTANNNAMPEYVTAQSGRSWGYYFDKELTQKVPYGFVPVAAQTTVYVGFADYSEIAGRYYLKATEYSVGAYFDLTDDGRILLRDGGMTFSGTYSYNGEKITVYNSNFADLLYTIAEVNNAYFTVEGVKTDNVLTLSGIIQILDVENSTTENQITINTSITLTAVSAIDGFTYGEYFAANGAAYLFSEDGSGVYISATGARQEFTYEEGDNGEILMAIGGGEWTATVVSGVIDTVNGVKVSAKNVFSGVWKKSANSQISFAFDGNNKVTYAGSGAPQTVDFTVNGDRAVFTTVDGNYEATFNREGFLVINGETYYLDDGFTGSWYMYTDRERIEVTFEGIGKSGYGYSTILYAGKNVSNIDAQYNIFTDNDGSRLRIYVNDRQYGEIVFDSKRDVASGMFYSLFNEGYYQNATFYRYDSFKGTWMSVADGIDSVTFNGRAADGTSEVSITRGSTRLSGTYTLNADRISGSMTVGGNTYSIAYNENTNRISFKLGEAAANELARSDSWYGVVLYDGETSYTFDGKGYIGGTVAVSDGTKLSYSVAGDGTVTVGGAVLTPAGNEGFTLNGVTLAFKTGLEGEWLISGQANGASGKLSTITIGNIGSDFTASAAYSEGSGAFKLVYDPAAGTLSYTREVNGERIITEFRKRGTNEMEISQRSTLGDEHYNCVLTENCDDWKGVYAAANGTSWTFDGLGHAVYGSGTAIFTAADGTTTWYSYSFNTLGVPEIAMGSTVVFVEGDNGYSKVGDDKSYVTATPDALYDELAYVGTGESVDWYVFDGFGNLWRRGADNSYVKLYSYKIVSSTEVELTDGAGAKYKCTLKEAGRYYQLTIVAAGGQA